MSQTQFLVDTSALVRLLRQAAVQADWAPQITAGLVATCAITELELLYTARSKADREELSALIRETLSWVVMPDRVFERALDVQSALTDRGSHRSASPADLLLAATAEEHGLIVLHYDADLAEVAEVTGQPVRWPADRGTD
ncbi:MAG TPA: PIN domain nuclease [Actinoplanes sp.]|nr:PIN domain nuclease [Actinoplanes sp.]